MTKHPEGRLAIDFSEHRPLAFATEAALLAPGSNSDPFILQPGDEKKQLIPAREPLLDQPIGRQRQTHHVVGLDISLPEMDPADGPVSVVDFKDTDGTTYVAGFAWVHGTKMLVLVKTPVDDI